MLQKIMQATKPLSYWKIFRFWIPLALTWLMMSLEGPFLAAIVARLAAPKENLAAHGVAFAIAIIIEAPVIMIMSASTALVNNRLSFLKLRNFTYALNSAITLIMGLMLITPGMDYLTRDLIGLPDQVADLVYKALIIMLPWPAAIGYRRFYHGLIIRSGRTRLVALGTVFRLISMTALGFMLFFVTELPGALISASALTTGVLVEAVISRFMARGVVRSLMERSAEGEKASLSYRGVTRFYFPLALTSVVSLAVHPMVTFFMGQARFPLESLAVIPVVNGVTFCFRALGLSFQEAAIALMGEQKEHFREVRNFAACLGLAAVSGMALIAFTPLFKIWFEDISGLTPALANFSLLPTMILVLIPGLSVLLSMQRAMLVKERRTTPISVATFLEVSGVVTVLMVTIHYFDLVGAVAAALALLLGRVAGNTYLVVYGVRTKTPR